MPRTRTRKTPLGLALAATAAFLAIAAPAATAATLGVANDQGHSYLRYAAAPGEANDLHVAAGPSSSLVFTDPGATIKPSGAACHSVSAHAVRCSASAAPVLGISLGDRDDRLVIDADKPALVGGDDGNDRLTGGPGDEGLWGGAGDDVLDGRGGADLLSGQSGSDTASYAGRTAPVTVDLTSLTLGTEGAAGERDTVASDVENVVGGNGNDALTGNDAANHLTGGAGNDVVAGGNGADRLEGGAGNDTLAGGNGADRLEGGAGNDTLVGGNGADRLEGGAGSDTVRSRDGATDSVDCGADGDAVDRDAVDVVTGCEGTAAPAGAGGAPRTPGNAPGGLTVPFSFTLGTATLPPHPVTLHRGHVALTVSCPADTPGGRCTGTITLERVAPHHKHATANASRRTKRRIGARDYSLRAGRSARVRVRIASAARRRLARNGTEKVNVYLRTSRRARHGVRIGTLKVHASRRTKRRLR